MSCFLLAQTTFSKLSEKMKQWLSNPDTQIIFTLGCLLAVVIIVVLAVWLFAGRDEKRRHRHHRSHRSPQPETPKVESSGKERKRKRRRPSGPSLAQTGGLPPKRDPNTPPHMP